MAALGGACAQSTGREDYTERHEEPMPTSQSRTRVEPSDPALRVRTPILNPTTTAAAASLRSLDAAGPSFASGGLGMACARHRSTQHAGSGGRLPPFGGVRLGGCGGPGGRGGPLQGWMATRRGHCVDADSAVIKYALGLTVHLWLGATSVIGSYRTSNGSAVVGAAIHVYCPGITLHVALSVRKSRPNCSAPCRSEQRT